MYGMTIVGMVSGQHTIEDIKTVVPYRVAVQIPANLVQVSSDLQDALHQKKVFKLSGALPAGAVFRGAGPIQRAGAPHLARPQPSQANGEVRELKQEVLKLTRELAAAHTREAQLQTLNTGLQTTLSGMSVQLQAIQTILEDLKKRGIPVVSGQLLPKGTFVEDDVPMFITSVADDKAQVNINVAEQASNRDLSASKEALRNLRKSKS